MARPESINPLPPRPAIIPPFPLQNPRVMPPIAVSFLTSAQFARPPGKAVAVKAGRVTLCAPAYALVGNRTAGRGLPALPAPTCPSQCELLYTPQSPGQRARQRARRMAVWWNRFGRVNPRAAPVVGRRCRDAQTTAKMSEAMFLLVRSLMLRRLPAL